ncbi:uncharacterized protein LOC111402018 isoform X1 [Olea europaea subsp. europaea]|uniref:Uncharacterized protein LOC111402018 isoform X1 n=1 Tax=Olea europaea subsp. europaea TaxID=158383 RepID=A0A8S0QTF3_OLEEU|nr:uncharacterized protein LOC111402018 isoform X1 [Olea europaea subsp. europaea]
MPTFTAKAFDRLIEPGAENSVMPVINASDLKLARRNSTPDSRLDRRIISPSSKLERGVSVPPNPKLNRTNGSSTTAVVDRRHNWTQISPALYATPESTPIPDAPSSFPPSPYIINHKRRGPRLMKSFSEDDVATHQQAVDENKFDANGKNAEKKLAGIAKDDSCVHNGHVGSFEDNNYTTTIPNVAEEDLNGVFDGEHGSSDLTNGSTVKNRVVKSVGFNLQGDSEVDDFFDTQDLMSVKSNSESEGIGVAERSLNSTTPTAEFYDAWEDLSSESCPQPSVPDIETDLREIRLSLLMEIEKRKQAEEILNDMRNQWKSIQDQLSLAGLTLPPDPTTLPGGGQSGDSAADLCQQVFLARFVSNLIGRGTVKAEVEMDMKAQIELKNSEIARLWDKLHYYEAVNREMSQRNQEAVETARKLRQRRKRRQNWVWGSIASAVTIGSAVILWSYFQTGKGSSSSSQSHDPAVEHGSKQ